MPLFCFQITSAGKITLVAADDKDGGQKNPQKQVVFRKEQRQKDSDADPEHDKTDISFHRRPTNPLLISLF